MARPLQQIKCFFLDMDGTIYLGGQLIAGTDRFIALLQDQGCSYYFLTNNSSRDKAAYVKKLAGLGIYAEANQVITSGEATARWLGGVCPGARIYLLGTPALAKEFRQHGFELVGREGCPQYVVLGFDTTLTYQKLWDACDLVRAGVGYVATHPDINCPLDQGRYMPDAGAIISFIHASTGRMPKVIGKPNREMAAAALARAGVAKEQAAVVGDRLYTDIAMAQAAGMTSVLVLSGETRRSDLIDSCHQPDYVFPSVAQLADALLHKSDYCCRED